MITRRTRIIVLALIVLAFLLLLIWLLWLLWPRAQETAAPEPVQEEVVQELPPARPTTSQKELEAEQQTRSASSDVVSLSKTFVERYGSYSNEADFANLRDVLPLMSAALATTTQAFIDLTPAPERYYGVTTRVITVRVDEQTDTRARVTVSTQREESIGSPTNKSVRYQDIVLTYVKEEGAWKVDSATWQ